MNDKDTKMNTDTNTDMDINLNVDENNTEDASEKGIVDLITNVNSIAIFSSKTAGVDAFCAGVGLFHMLKEQKADVSFVYMGNIPEGCEGLIDPEDITSDIFERELLVSIDYSETPAAKVHYSTKDDVLYLKVKPIDKSFDLSRVDAKIKGFNFDLVITIGAQELEDFGQVYSELGNEFNSATIINIDNTEQNTRFGSQNIVNCLADSLSLLVLQKASEWKFNINTKSAKALLGGITHRNNN